MMGSATPSRPERQASATPEKGTTPLVATADFGYFRLRDEGYSPDDLTQWSRTVRAG